MTEEPAVRHYKTLWGEHRGQISDLMLQDGGLRTEAASVVQGLTPAMQSLTEGTGSTVLTSELLEEAEAFLRRLAEADRAAGGGALAADIEAEVERVDIDSLGGLTVNEAAQRLNALVSAS